MNEKPTIITERVDDLPLLLAQMDRMGCAGLLDAHLPSQGNWQGSPLGRLVTIGLRSRRSRGEHRLVHVEPWVAQRQITRSQIPGAMGRAPELSADRLAIVLRLWSAERRWTAFASALNQPRVRVEDLRAARVHVESTSASTDAGVSEDGLWQFGHRQDRRPDVPQVQGIQAVLDPRGMPRATDVVAGNRAAAPLYVPCMERVQARWERRG
jgi:transposase